MRIAALSFVFVSALGLSACGKSGDKAASAAPATCATAVDHAIKIMMDSDEMKKASPEEKKMAEAMITGMKGEMVKQCEEKKPAQKDLDCVAAAKVPDDLEKCGGFMK